MLAITLFSLAIFERKIRKLIFLILCFIVLAMILRPGIYHSIKSTFKASFGHGVLAGSTEYRKAIFLSVLHAILKSPLRILLGYGDGTGRYLGLSGYVFDIFMRFQAIDNGYAGILLERGMVGFIAFLILFFSLHRYFYQHQKNIKFSWIVKAFNASLVGIYFILYTVGFLDWHQPSYLFWILLGMTMGICEEEKQ